MLFPDSPVILRIFSQGVLTDVRIPCFLHDPEQFRPVSQGVVFCDKSAQPFPVFPPPCRAEDGVNAFRILRTSCQALFQFRRTSPGQEQIHPRITLRR